MRIARLLATAVALPMARPMKMSGVEIATADNVLVRVEEGGGGVGWGEAASAPSMTGETVASMVAAVRYLASFLEGLPAEGFGAIHAEMDWRLYGNHAAKSAIDMALHDLVARARNMPVHALLGAQRRARVPALWMIGTGSTEGDLQEAAAKRAAGFVAYKIKVGAADPQADAERTARICAALGPGRLISADANQAWTPEQAIGYVGAVASTALDFLEQPVRGDDLAGMARIAAASRVAIGADEGIHGLDDIARHHQARAAGGVSLKTIKLGGLGAAHQAALLCEQLGMKVNLACKMAETGIASSAMTHIAAAIPTLDWGVSLTSPYLTDDLIERPLDLSGGHVALTAGPGIGVEVDEAKVRRYTREV